MPSVCSKSSEESALARCLSIEAEQRLPPMTMTGSKNSAEKDWLSLSVNCAADRFWAAALATSAPLGTTFDGAGQDGHILAPLTGAPVRSPWRSVSITAPSAGLADALTTAACLQPGREEIVRMLKGFDGAELVGLEAAA